MPRRLLVHAALATSGLATALVMLDGSPSRAGARLFFMVVALCAYAVMMVVESRHPLLRPRAVVAASVILLGLAVAIPPQGSRDLWSYATYGRIVAHYHQNPYRRDADDYPHDPIAALVAPAWRAAPSVYGPAFVVVTAAGSVLAGTSPTANRLFFQGLAAAAVLGVLFLLAAASPGTGAGTGAGALAFVGLNPVLLAVVVNGGHNDVVLGAVVLAGALLAPRRRVTAGVILGLAVLVKVVAALSLAAVAVWVWRTHGRRAAGALAASGAGVVLAGYALAGGWSALQPVLADRGFHSRASIWTPLRGIGPALRSPTTIAIAFGLVLVAVLAGRARGSLPPLAGAVVVVYLLAAPYVLPWYMAWALPVVALVWRSRLAAIVAAYAGAVAVAFVNRPSLDPDALHTALTVFTVAAVPAMAVGSLIYLIGLSWRTDEPRTGARVSTDDPSLSP